MACLHSQCLECEDKGRRNYKSTVMEDIRRGSGNPQQGPLTCGGQPSGKALGGREVSTCVLKDEGEVTRQKGWSLSPILAYSRCSTKRGCVNECTAWANHLR